MCNLYLLALLSPRSSWDTKFPSKQMAFVYHHHPPAKMVLQMDLTDRSSKPESSRAGTAAP